jgi:hypothetical protein
MKREAAIWLQSSDNDNKSIDRQDIDVEISEIQRLHCRMSEPSTFKEYFGL